MYRQGDVLIVREAIPQGCKPGSRDDDRIVLAYGEATGHAHAITDPDVSVLVAPDGRVYLSVPGAGATVRHEEHAPVILPSGTYRVVRQREYSPEAIRYVAD